MVDDLAGTHGDRFTSIDGAEFLMAGSKNPLLLLDDVKLFIENRSCRTSGWRSRQRQITFDRLLQNLCDIGAPLSCKIA